MVLGYENGEISIYSLKRKAFVGKLEAHASEIITADLLETDSGSLFLVTVSKDKAVRVHDLLLKETLTNLPEHLSKVVAARFLNFAGRQKVLSQAKENKRLATRVMDSSLLTLSNEGILTCFDFNVPVMTQLLTTKKQNLQFLEIILLNSSADKVTPVALVSSGDEDLLLSALDVAPFKFNEPSIFKRSSFTRVIDLIVVNNSHVLLLLESMQVEIIQILDHSQVLKKYKRKKQRKVKNLPEMPEFLQQANQYFVFKKAVKLDTPVQSLKVDMSRSKKDVHEIYFFSSKNYYLKGKLRLKENEESIEEVRKLSNFGHEHAIHLVVISPDDSMIFTASKEGCFLWESVDCTLLKKLHLELVSCAFFIKNKYLVAGDKQGQVWLIDVALGETINITTLIGKGAFTQINMNIYTEKSKIM